MPTAADPTPPPPDGPPRPRWPVSGTALGVTLGLWVAATAAISPWFKTPLPTLLGRTLVLAVVLLAVFAAARRLPDRWLPAWLPRWLPAVMAVAVAAPLTTLIVYTLALGGDVAQVFDSLPHRWGYWITAGTALVLGLVVTLAALLREREAQVRARELQFALERSRLERQALDARLALLQAQIEPHFLFNTLANVQALVESGSPRAPALLKSLIDYLRAAMPQLHDGEATLAQELARVQAYLALMRMRMPDRLHFSVDADPALPARRFPPMALLTLVENAVRHGIDPLEDGGRIDVRAAPDAGGWQVSVTDDGAGLDPHRAPGTGLANLRERLQGFYGPGAALEIEPGEPRGLVARIRIPAADLTRP